MSAPIRPEPESWLVQDARGRLDPLAGRQVGPQSQFAPADASAVRLPPQARGLGDAARMARRTTGGVAEGIARLPVDIAALATLPATLPKLPGTLQTVGRGQVRWSNQPGLNTEPLTQALALGEQGAAILGDEIGGAPQDESEQAFRGLGSFAGNLLAWERLPLLLRNRVPRPTEVDFDVLTGRSLPPNYAKGRVLREIPPSNPVPSGIAYIDRPPSQTPYTGPVTRQEFFDQHLRQLGLLK